MIERESCGSHSKETNKTICNPSVMLNTLIKLLNLFFIVLIALIFLLDDRSFDQLHNLLLASKQVNSTSPFDNMASSSGLPGSSAPTNPLNTFENLNTVDMDTTGRFKYGKI